MGFEADVYDDKDEAELRGAHSGVCETHFTLEVAVNVDVDAEHEISHKGKHCKAHVHKGTEAHSNKHYGFIDNIYIVVNVKAVGFALGVPYACKGTVQGISEPVDKKAKAGKPQPVQVKVCKGVTGGHHYGTKEAYESEHIGGDPGGHTLCQPHQYFLLQRVKN